MKCAIKHVVFLLVVSYLSAMANAQTPVTKDWVQYKLKGNVESIKEIIYEGSIVKGKPVKGDTISEGESMHFTPAGMFTAYKSPLYYGPGGRLAGWRNITRIFNSAGFIKEEVTEITGDTSSKSVKRYTYKFDNAGNMVAETVNPKSGDKYTIEYKYDEQGNCIEADNSGQIIQYKYDGQRRRIAEITGDHTIRYDEQGNPIPSPVKNNTPTLRYNQQGDLIYSKVYNEMDEAWEEKAYEYQYDDTGNWIEKASYYYESGKKKLHTITARTMAYFSETDIANATTTMINKSQSLSGNYIVDLKYRIFNQGHLSGTPSGTLMKVLIALSILLLASIIYLVRSKKEIGLFRFANMNQVMFSSFLGKTNYKTGMRKLWMYNKEPYFKVSLILLTALISFIIALCLIFIFGGITWGVFWIVKLLLLVLILVGWILLVGGGLIAWAGFSGEGGCGAIVGGIVAALIGSSIIGAKSAIKETGNRLVETGFEFMQRLNMFEWGIDLFRDFWDVLLMVFVLPLFIFIVFALVIILLNAVLRGIEFVITKIYNVRRPCSTCGYTKKFIYLTPDTANAAHPVPLRPGVYGSFHQTSPKTDKKLPTMLLNGRGKLKRQCVNCNNIIIPGDKGSFGTDIHIGVVGHRSSGKSYLLYSGLSLLQKMYPDKCSQIDVDSDTKIEGKIRRIDAREGIQTDNKSKYRAVQLIYKEKGRPVPHHLFFYDVAGEKFDASSSSHLTAMEFYKNVQSIVFVIDPLMVDFTGIPGNDDLLNWIEQKDKGVGEKYNIGNSFSMLKDILDKVGNKSQKIDFNFVCVKKDLKYFEALGYNSNTITSSEIKKFISNDMGFHNVVNSAKAEFKKVNFYAVSAISNDTSSLKHLFSELLKQRSIKL